MPLSGQPWCCCQEPGRLSPRRCRRSIDGIADGLGLKHLAGLLFRGVSSWQGLWPCKAYALARSEQTVLRVGTENSFSKTLRGKAAVGRGWWRPGTVTSNTPGCASFPLPPVVPSADGALPSFQVPWRQCTGVTPATASVLGLSPWPRSCCPRSSLSPHAAGGGHPCLPGVSCWIGAARGHAGCSVET